MTIHQLTESMEGGPGTRLEEGRPKRGFLAGKPPDPAIAINMATGKGSEGIAGMTCMQVYPIQCCEERGPPFLTAVGFHLLRPSVLACLTVLSTCGCLDRPSLR